MSVAAFSDGHGAVTHSAYMLRASAPIRRLQQTLRHASIEITQICTRVIITDLNVAHHRFHSGDQHYGGEAYDDQQSDPPRA